MRILLPVACALGTTAGLARIGWRLGPAADAVWIWGLAAAGAASLPGLYLRLRQAFSWRGSVGLALFAGVESLLVAREVLPASWAGEASRQARADLLLPLALAGIGTRDGVLRLVEGVRERIRRGLGAPITPPQIFLLSFVAVILLGAIALMLPRAGRPGAEGVGAIDCLFTSTSAVCVTGLATFDVGSRLSFGGQAVLLALIQLGGLGLMTYVAFFSLLLGRGLAASQHAVMREMVTARFAIELRRAVLVIVALTLGIEAVGALLLYLAGVDSTGGRVWCAVFHSISSFCNAGFALWPDNLVGFARRPAVLAVVALLVAVGGLGFTALLDLGRWIASRGLRRPDTRALRLSLHTRVVLSCSTALVVAGAIGFLACEWSGVLAGFSLVDRVSNALFHSVIPRTAGFNSVDIGRLGAPALLLTIGLMFVGASPGSTGGGIKTSTLVVLIAAVRSLAANQESVHLLGRNLPLRVVRTALVLFALGTLAVFVGTFALAVLEPDIPVPALAFETVSALGTVGLSTGITPSLSAASKLVVCVLMFVGRVGPVTLLFSMAGAAQPARYEYAEEEVLVG